MAMQLGCNACGASVSVDEPAVRRALAVCGQCNSILRVDGHGSCGCEDLPDSEGGLFVDRLGDSDLSVTALRPRTAWALNNLTSTAGWSAGVAAAAACTASFGGVGALAGVPAALAAFVAAAKLQRRHRPVEIRGGLILPSDPLQAPLAVADLQQIYSAVCHLDLGGDSSFSTANVFALTHAGERVLLIGPVEDEAVAARLRRFLCHELKLDEFIPRDRTAATCESATTDPTARHCEACGVSLSPNAAELRRCLAECSECHGLTWLGDFDSAPAALRPQRYEIVVDEDGLSIDARDDRDGSLEVHGGQLTLRRLGMAPLSLVMTELSHFRVCEPELAAFSVVGEHFSRGSIELASSMGDAREAFAIARALGQVLAKSR